MQGEREPPREVKNTPQTQGKKISKKKEAKTLSSSSGVDFFVRSRERTEADTRER